MTTKDLPKLMLAATARSVEEVVSRPGTWLMSKKHNGIRAIVWNGQLLSRTLKPFPNKDLNRLFLDLYGARGLLAQGDEIELILRDRDGKDLPLEFIQSVVMSKDKPFTQEPLYTGHLVTWGRYGQQVMPSIPPEFATKHLEATPYDLLDSEGDLAFSLGCAQAVYKEVTEAGGEGLIFRRIEAGYKHGRSTLKEGAMVKVKPLLDSEYLIRGVSEELAKDGTPKGTLGSITCEVSELETVSVGSGFTAEQRKELWKVRNTLPGKYANISFASRFAKTGVPQFPVFNYIQEVA